MSNKANLLKRNETMAKIFLLATFSVGVYAAPYVWFYVDTFTRIAETLTR